jgi:hypothetical protein
MCLLFLSRNIEERNGPGQAAAERARLAKLHDGVGSLVKPGGGEAHTIQSGPGESCGAGFSQLGADA